MKKTPAKFLLKNSKGYPDFVMTMLVAVILCLFVVLLYWMMLNLIGIQLLASDTTTDNAKSVSDLLKNFNENSQIIIIGICSSVFSLAGSYYLRRSAYDNHYVEKKKLDMEIENSKTIKTNLDESEHTSIGNPNFDETEEDI